MILTLTYLHTGQMPAIAEPEDLFGLLKNAHYLASDRLIHDCSTTLIAKLESTQEFEPYATHEAFEVTWVPVMVVTSSLSAMAPVAALRMVVHWQRNQASPLPDEVDKVMSSCQELSAECSANDLLQLIDLPSRSPGQGS